MLRTNGLAPTSKSAITESWVVSEGGEVPHEAGRKESTVGGESIKIKVRKVNV